MNRLILIFILFGFTLSFLGCKTESKRELSGYRFEGEHVEIDAGSSVSLTESITIDMFIMLHSYPSSSTSIIQKWVNDRSTEFNLRIVNNEVGEWFYGDGKRSEWLRWSYKPKTVLPLNEWVRLTAIRDISNNTMEVFVNGQSVSKKSAESIQESAKTKSSIDLLRHRGRRINATIADVRIWSKSLTAKEIARTSGQIKDPLEQPDLVGYWQFDKVENGRVKDLSRSSWDAFIK